MTPNYNVDKNYFIQIELTNCGPSLNPPWFWRDRLHVSPEYLGLIEFTRVSQHWVHNVNLRLDNSMFPWSGKRFSKHHQFTKMKQLCDQSTARQTSHSRSHQGLAAVHRITTVKSFILSAGFQLSTPILGSQRRRQTSKTTLVFFNFYIWRLPSHFPTFTSTYTISRWRFYLPKFCLIFASSLQKFQK